MRTPAGPSARVALLLLVFVAACTSPVATPDPSGAACGNGIVESGEECDDGNLSNLDSCLVSCYAPARFVASDPHVHSRGCLVPPTSPASLMSMLQGEGIEVGAALVWGDGFADDAPLFTGSDHPLSGGGRILHYDMEISAFAAGDSGHLVLLGLRSLGFSPDPFRTPRSGLSIPAWAKAQGERVVVGMAHGQFWAPTGFRSPPVPCCVPWEFPVQVARGGASFLITERRGDGPPVDDGTFLIWRALLNSGYRVALLGGSDYPCVHHEIDDSSPRTDVLVNGALTYDSWLEGVRLGRTVITMDRRHRLNLRVNGSPLGSEVAARAGQVLLVSIESEAPERTGVELLSNGAPLLSVVLPAGRQVATVRVGLPASSWLSARTLRAATGAIYVVVDGKPIRSSAGDTCYLMKYIDHLSGLVGSGRIDLGSDTSSALAAYQGARSDFETRFREAGGSACF